MLFFHFSKICEHARFVTRSEQNYESDSSEIFTVAIYENVLHDSNSLLQYRHHRAVRLSTYRTALIYGKSYIRYIYYKCESGFDVCYSFINKLFNQSP